VKLGSTDQGRSGVFARVMAKEAGWDLLNMAALRLTRGEKYASLTKGFEHVTVVLGGTCHIRTSRGDFHDLGVRENVFSGKASALYLPRDTLGLDRLHALAVQHGGPSHPLVRALETPLYRL